MLQYGFTFTVTCFPVFASLQTLIAYADGDGSLITNTIITILAGAVAVLWKRIEANYKKLETENSGLKFEISLTKDKIKDCETDRTDLRREIETMKQNGCTFAKICNKKDN